MDVVSCANPITVYAGTSLIFTTVKEALLANGFSLPADIKEVKLYDKAPPIKLSVHNQGIEGRED